MAFQTFKRRTAANSLEALGAPDGVINVRDGEGLVIDTNVLAVDAVNNRVGINVGSPSKARATTVVDRRATRQCLRVEPTPPP